MIKIIITVDSYKFLETPIKEYKKRLGKQLETIKLKPSKKDTIPEIIREETKELKNILKKENGYKILLTVDGKKLSSVELNKLIENKKQTHSNIIFIIGGAYGVDELELKGVYDEKLTLSDMTFTHIIAYLLLLEQIYRSLEIDKGTGYHH